MPEIQLEHRLKLPVAGIKTNVFTKDKWEKHFRTKIHNRSEYSWDEIITGCEPLNDTECDVKDVSSTNSEKIDYANLGTHHFWKGIKQALKTMANKGAFILEEVVRKGNNINIPFVNQEEVKFVLVFYRTSATQPGIKVFSVKKRKNNSNVVIILPPIDSQN
jgi:hypothetical protein